jgi:DeoR/GlpR family transcriptional regulator of sugar metabolism
MLDYASFPDQRQELIKMRLLRDGRVICVQLATELGVSEHTIRRDLQELASKKG